MNFNVNRAGLLFGSLVAGTGLIFSASTGCGNSSSGTSPEEAGTDATADSSGDVVNKGDAGSDADAATINDSGTGFVDVGDVAIDVPPLGQFPHAVDEAYCTRLEQCCLVPAGQWNQATNSNGCVPLDDFYGGFVRIAAFNAALDSGLVQYDASAAKTCLDYVLSFTCGTVPASAITFIRDQCFGAMQGTLTAGNGPCVDSLECTGGLYCQLTADGGPGSCAPLKTQGQPCADTTRSTDCSYLGFGTPPLYCAPAEGGTPTCQPVLPVDAGCTEGAQCQTWTCNSPSCVNSFVFSDPGQPNGTCAYFTLLDAGGD